MYQGGKGQGCINERERTGMYQGGRGHGGIEEGEGGDVSMREGPCVYLMATSIL